MLQKRDLYSQSELDRQHSVSGYLQMFEELTEDGVIHMSEAMDALSELEKNTSQAITALRSSQRVDIRTKVWIQPGNSSLRSTCVMEGLTADISNGGCMILTPRPLMVGDIFWMRFSDDEIRINPLLVRCLRCRLVREDAFEIGIRFLSNIDLTHVFSKATAASK